MLLHGLDKGAGLEARHHRDVDPKVEAGATAAATTTTTATTTSKATLGPPSHLVLLQGLDEGAGLEPRHHRDLDPEVEAGEAADVHAEDVEHGEDVDGAGLEGLWWTGKRTRGKKIKIARKSTMRSTYSAQTSFRIISFKAKNSA